MIHATHLNGQAFYINAALIQFVESTPDTLITLTSGARMMVRETAEEIVARVTAYHCTCRGMVFPSSSEDVTNHGESDENASEP